MSLPGRILGAVAVAAGLAAAVAATARLAGPPLGPTAKIAFPATGLAARLASCRAQGEHAPSDPSCQAAWRETREAFLGEGRGRVP